MATITVDQQVFMTHGDAVAKAQSIGTDGLGPCVGLIAVLGNGKVFCGHFACSVTGEPKNKDLVKAKATALLAAQIGPAAGVQAVHCATGNLREPTAKWMIEAVKEHYKIGVMIEATGIYWAGNEPHPVPANTKLAGRAKGDTSENGPLEVKAA
jgi:hypothetical protein